MVGRLKLADGFTFLGLLAGILAVVSALNSHIGQTAILILVSAVFDKLDGWLAKATKTANRFGMYLDSLVDICVFGFVPVAVSFILVDVSVFMIAASAIYLFAGVYRLARFQIEHSTQSKVLRGIPITVNAVLFPLVLYSGLFIGFEKLFYIIPIYFILSAVLMVSRVRVPHW